MKPQKTDFARKCIIFFLYCISSSLCFSLDIGLDLSETLTTEPNYNWQFQSLDLAMVHESENFGFNLDMAALNDGLYMTNFAAQLQLGYYFMLKSGGVSFTAGPLSIRAGKLAHHDAIESPYSLFISSNGNSSVLADISFDDGLFFFTTRWLGLNYLSALGYPDRGAVYKTIGIRWGEFRGGFQDAVVFTGRFFDAGYFLNPISGFIIQMSSTQPGSPWQQADNANGLMGLFFEYDHAAADLSPIRGWSAYAQILVDDINGNRFLHPEDYQNPDKIAWSIGGGLRTDFGDFGLFHAGATKYTFQPFGSAGYNTDYGYTYYPAASFIRIGGIETPIPLEQNYIGYLHGENNLAFMATYSGAWFEFETKAALEFLISGSLSPANPWGVYDNWEDGGQGTHLLDDPLLEKRLTFSLSVERDFSDWRFGIDVKMGYAWNALVLAQIPEEFVAPENDIPMFVPSNTDLLIAQCAFRVKYAVKIKGDMKK